MAGVDPREYAPDAAALDWFLRHRAGDVPVLDASRPIRRALGNLERWARGDAAVAPEADPRESGAVRQGYLDDVAYCDLFLGRGAGWWVRILEGHEQRRRGSFSVEPSFVSYILGDRDAPGHDGPWIPGGLATLYLATRCLHLGGGLVHIGGNESPGADVYWRPDPRIAILIERKDRAFYRAFDPGASFEGARKWLLEEVRRATNGLVKRATARPSRTSREVVGVASVGGVFPMDLAERLHQEGVGLAHEVIRRARKMRRPIPSALLVYVLGVSRVGDAPSVASLSHTVELVPEGFVRTPAFDALRRAFDRAGMDGVSAAL